MNNINVMATKIAFFDAKSYDRENFNSTNGEFGFDITFASQLIRPMLWLNMLLR